MTIEQVIGTAQRTINRETVTAQVVRVDDTGVWVAPVGSDTRTPIGPCRGTTSVAVGDSVLLSWTSDGPWIQAELDTSSFETPAGAQAKVNAGVESHRADTTDVHGIADTAQLETKTGAQAKANAARDAAITAAVSEILGGAPPAALDTLVELAAALQDDEDAIAAITLALAGKETPAGAQAKVDAARDAHQDPDTRWHGDSGVRRLVDAGDIVDLPDLVLCARRVGDVVSIWTREPIAATHTGAITLFTLPAGFRPDAEALTDRVYDPDADAFVAGAGLVVRHDGTVRLLAVSGARHLAGVTGTVSSAWPTSYPGTVD